MSVTTPTATSRSELAAVLLDDGLLSPEELEAAEQEQDRTGHSLGRVLIDLGLFTEAGLLGALAKRMGLQFVDLSEVVVDAVAAAAVSDVLARRHTVLPITVDPGGELVVAMSDPADVVALDDLRSATGMRIRPVVASRADLLAAIDRHMRMGESVEDVAGEILVADEDAGDLARLREITDEAPIVKFVNAIISQAVGDRASDIHIEPQEHDLRVRYRVDGVLHEMTHQSRKIHSGVVSRLKIMADLDIAERRIPQDGRISLRAGGKSVDLRVSTLPTVFGEKVVLRILDKSSILLQLSDLGFSQENAARFERSYRKPYGMILVTGPTGSGKSTTLYATLNVINKTEVNIVTVEDPVEYRLPGVNQVQVHPKAGLTFSEALRSILRQDPDVVLVGEMRDQETAKIGMEAALTGHLVLSTLHTNDAPSAVTRLTEMKVDPFLVASSVMCVLAQRLARKLCTKCKEPFEPSEAERAAAKIAPGEQLLLHRAIGCSACAKTGYRGRLALHEVLEVTEEIERLIVAGASVDVIAAMAHEQGMTTLRDDGLAKVRAGITTLEEIGRVVV